MARMSLSIPRIPKPTGSFFAMCSNFGCRTVSNPPACQTRRINSRLHALPFAASPSAPQSQRELYDEGDHDIYDKAAQLAILLDAINSRGLSAELTKSAIARFDLGPMSAMAISRQLTIYSIGPSPGACCSSALIPRRVEPYDSPPRNVLCFLRLPVRAG